jgi:hypothetical protein
MRELAARLLHSLDSRRHAQTFASATCGGKNVIPQKRDKVMGLVFSYEWIIRDFSGK